MIETHLSNLVHNFTASEDPDQWDLTALQSAVRTIMPVPATLTSNSWVDVMPQEIEEQLLELAHKNYEEMEEALGSDVMRQAEKQLMLQTLDRLWVRHLTALDSVREGIGLRAYGQQDPLVAFQKEAYEMYGQFQAVIQEDIVRRIYHPTIIREAPRPKNLQARHPDAEAASQRQAAAQAETPGASAQAPEPIRVQKTPGRNDPCHCGSGKKYKQCHMKLDMAGGGNGAQKSGAYEKAVKQQGKQKKKAKARR
jgi:preprotein translocase subunit SecA